MQELAESGKAGADRGGATRHALGAGGDDVAIVLQSRVERDLDRIIGGASRKRQPTHRENALKRALHGGRGVDGKIGGKESEDRESAPLR